jgi:hypothetical protein
MTMPEPNTGCRLWLGSVCASGYGRVSYGRAGSPVLVHRIAFEQANGAFDRNLKVCHRCDTPSCVNPDHLFLATQKDNLRDMFAKGRANPRGHRPRRVELLRTVAFQELASVDSNTSVGMRDILHLTRTNEVVASWRHVTGVPARRPANAIVVWKRPLEWTLNPSTQNGNGYADGATPAPCCASPERTAGGGR